ncbi:hypothetical protein [Chitinibacter sp. GC72]|uniref:hypothetical protein n=1 Tax=Chitinibacter sp. GC72 TaxID=1526917 RepID=UPI0012FC98E1|nr:hypothetical protein [Chitinibacter sp. GC72]
MLKVLQIIKITLAAFVAVILAVGSYIAWSFYYGVTAERTTFSPTAWKEKANVYEHSSDPGCVRGGMAIDIVTTNLLRDKSITEVKLLLGEPDVTKEAKVYYELGQCSGHGWHNSVLLVSFQDNQQVSSAAILRN